MTTFLRKPSMKALLLIIVAAGFLLSIFGNILLYSANSQLSSTIEDEKRLVVQSIAFSLEALDALPLPGPLARDKYSNISIVETSSRHIVYHSSYGRSTVQQLITLDSAHSITLTQIDGVFVSFVVFADNLNELVSENKTSSATTVIEGFTKTMSDLPRELGWTLQSAYDVRGTVNEQYLERALEQAAQIRALLQSMLTESD